MAELYASSPSRARLEPSPEGPTALLVARSTLAGACCSWQAKTAVASGGYVRFVELFFPVSQDERDALLRRAWTHAELAGLHRIEWDNAGIDEDAIWVAAEVSDDVVRQYEEHDSGHLGYRSFILPRDVLNVLPWRVVAPAESAAAAQVEADAAAATRERARRPD
jgi:hypothetical protein